MSRRRQRVAMRPAFSTDQIFNVAKSARTIYRHFGSFTFASVERRTACRLFRPSLNDAFRKFSASVAQTSRCANTHRRLRLGGSEGRVFVLARHRGRPGEAREQKRSAATRSLRGPEPRDSRRSRVNLAQLVRDLPVTAIIAAASSGRSLDRNE